MAASAEVSYKTELWKFGRRIGSERDEVIDLLGHWYDDRGSFSRGTIRTIPAFAMSCAS